jgi:hypothetical protein
MDKYYANWESERKRRDESTRRNWDNVLKYQREWKAERRATDYSYRVHQNISRRLRDSIKKGAKRRVTWEKMLGYSTENLMKHLESRFTHGMSWENYGEWHIDHKIPIVHFKLCGANDEEMISKCWCLNNLQPLWARDNLIKGDR